MLKSIAKKIYRRFRPKLNELFLQELITKTNNFESTKWLGNPIWQNILDLWTIQETLAEIRPELLIECGTNKGGSSLFFANLFDIMGSGEIITIDVDKLHNLNHPRVTYLLGSSVSNEILDVVKERVKKTKGPIIVILDSDHSQQHVRKELEHYTRFVTPGSYCFVQDGIIDQLSAFSNWTPGPLAAIEDFIKTSTEFEVDQARCDRFLITHHPKGWLKRKK